MFRLLHGGWVGSGWVEARTLLGCKCEAALGSGFGLT